MVKPIRSSTRYRAEAVCWFLITVSCVGGVAEIVTHTGPNLVSFPTVLALIGLFGVSLFKGTEQAVRSLRG